VGGPFLSGRLFACDMMVPPYGANVKFCETRINTGFVGGDDPANPHKMGIDLKIKKIFPSKIKGLSGFLKNEI
jgi:hypothetical protein